ncbi:TraB family protein, partial [Aphelenchoides avenae]
MAHRFAWYTPHLHRHVQAVLGQAASSSQNPVPRPMTYATSSDNNRSTLVELDPESVTILDAPSEPSVLPALHCDAEEYKRFYRQAKVYVLGTAHGFVESIVDIADLMRNVRPDVVFLELDEQRMRRILKRKWRANEFLAAHLLAKRLPDCEVVLGDRKANVTLMRVGFKGLREFLRMPFLEENRASRERLAEIIT